MKADGRLWIRTLLNRVLSLIDRWALILLTVLVVLLVLPRLGQGSLRDWDESIYAQVAREMIQSGDWINQHHGYEPYFEKPPLLMWTIAVLYRLFGISELWARMPSAISGLLLIWVTYFIGRELYDKRTGVLAGLILLSSHGFILQARNGTTNMMLTLLVVTGIYGYIRLGQGNQKWWYVILGACALGFMAKFWAALVLPATIFIVLLLENKISETLRNRHFWGGVVLSAVIVLPWHLRVYLNNPDLFIHAYMSRNLVARTLTPLEGHYGTTFFYMDVLRQNFSPWYFLLPFAVVLALRETIGQEKKSPILITAILLIIGLYTFVVKTKIDIYILPVFPPLALLMGYFFRKIFSIFESDLFFWIVTGTLMATTVIQSKVLILGIVLVVLLVILCKIKTYPTALALQLFTGLVFGILFLSSIVNSFQGNDRLGIWSVYELENTPMAQIARLAGQANPSKVDPIIGFEVEGPAAIFYSNRPVQVATRWEQLVELVNNQDSGEIIIAENYLDRLSEDFDVLIIEKVDSLVYARIH